MHDGGIDEGFSAEELLGELFASDEGHVLAQAEVDLLLDEIADFRGGSNDAEEDEEDSYLAYIRKLGNEDRTADLFSLGL